MTTEHTTTLPFADWGPSDRYWLDAFDPGAGLHRFLPVGPVDDVPFPQERMVEWERHTDRRMRLVEALRKTALPFSTRQLESIDRLQDPRAMVVATGQQPGALGGPLYTFAKILSAIVFAERLSEKWNLPVIPILWDGGDDHDLEEIAELKWLGGAEGTPSLKFDLSPYVGRSGWQVPFTNEMLGEAIRFVESHHPPTEFRETALSFLNSIGSEGLSWSDFFDRFWLMVFENSPLLVIRPWEIGYRKLAAAVLEAEIEAPRAYLEDLARTSGELEATGYSPRIHKKEGACSFFYYQEGQRLAVHCDKNGQSFSAEGAGTLTKERLQSAYVSDPGRLSPNALLRPIVQDSILPTAATVLGPSEIAYHAQLGEMYHRHRVVRPWIIPRLSLSLIGANHRSRLAEMGLSIPDLQRDANELSKALVSSEDLDTSLSVLDDLVGRTQSGREKLLELARKRKTGLERGLESQFGKIEATLQQLADLLRREELKRNTEWVDRIKSLQQSLSPGGNLQERTVGLVPFLCRFGFEWLKEIQIEAHNWNGQEHVVYTP